MRHSFLTVLLLMLLQPSLAQAEVPAGSPISQGRYHFSGGAGFSSESVSISAGFGYFVLDGLMPGARYRYTRFSDDRIDDHASLHDLNIYARYYFAVSDALFPFVVVDVGYLKMLEWGKSVANRMADMFSVMGGGGAAYYLSSHFFVDVSLGIRHYFDPPTWSYIYPEPNQFEWGLGFGASF